MNGLLETRASNQARPLILSHIDIKELLCYNASIATNQSVLFTYTTQQRKTPSGTSLRRVFHFVKNTYWGKEVVMVPVQWIIEQWIFPAALSIVIGGIIIYFWGPDLVRLTKLILRGFQDFIDDLRKAWKDE